MFSKKNNLEEKLSFSEVKKMINAELEDYLQTAESQKQVMPEIKYDIRDGSKIIEIPITGSVDSLWLLKEAAEGLMDINKIRNLQSKSGIKAQTGLGDFELLNDELSVTVKNVSQYNDEPVFIDGECLNIMPRTIAFSKKSDFTQEEIHCIVEAYKKGNIIKLEPSAENVLASLGAEIYTPDEDLDWKVMAGYEDVKQLIMANVINPLIYPELYDSVAKQTKKFYKNNRPKAILFEGPPGTGKTLAGRIIASQANVSMIYLPIEAILSKWYGESPKKLAKAFDTANKIENSILFIDEIDSLATARDNDMNEATRRVLGVLLRKLDGLSTSRKTITLFATNKKEDLDPALLRRIGASIYFRLPNAKEREEIVSLYAKHLDRCEVKMLAKISEGMSGSNIEELCSRVDRNWASKIVAEAGNSEKNCLKLTPPFNEYIKELSIYLPANSHENSK